MGTGQLSHLLHARRRKANMSLDELNREKERRRMYDKIRYEKRKMR